MSHRIGTIFPRTGFGTYTVRCSVEECDWSEECLTEEEARAQLDAHVDRVHPHPQAVYRD